MTLNKLFAGNKTIQDIVNDYSGMLLRIAFQNIKSLSDAEDIVQETYIKLINSNMDFNNEEHLKAWLIRVTINKCKDHFKSSWFIKTVLISESMDFLAPEEKGIMNAIFSLDRKYRNVIYLYYYEGYSIKEIATILNKNANTISSLLQRARKNLKTIILEEGKLI